MKRAVLSIASVAFLVIMSIGGCKKYEEGPWLSFKSKTNRIANKWKIQDRLRNGSSGDCDSYCLGKTIEFTKDKMYLEKSGDKVLFEGIWYLHEKKMKIGIKYTDNEDYEYFRIKKLKNKEMWLEGEDGPDVVETHYIPAGE